MPLTPSNGATIDVPVVAVIHLGVDRVAVAAEVVVDAGAAKDGAGATIIDCHLGRHHADAGGPLDEDRVLRQQRVVLLDPLFEPVQEDADRVAPEQRLVRVCDPSTTARPGGMVIVAGRS